jgi:hypothetical protein
MAVLAMLQVVCMYTHWYSIGDGVFVWGVCHMYSSVVHTVHTSSSSSQFEFMQSIPHSSHDSIPEGPKGQKHTTQRTKHQTDISCSINNHHTYCTLVVACCMLHSFAVIIFITTNQQSTMSAAIEDNLDQFIKTIKTFQSMTGSLDTKFYNGLKEIVNKAMKQVSDHTGEYLHNLREHQPNEDTLLKIIDNVPSSLSYEVDGWSLPINSALASKESVHYVPLLAKEGVKYNVNGDDARGGLFSWTNINIQNVLHGLVSGSDDETPYLNAMKKLRESNLLRKNDIKEHDLLYRSCAPYQKKRFDFLADWCPEGLKTHTYNRLPLIHAVIESSDLSLGVIAECLPVFLKASLKHHPNDLGLLFQKDSEGQTACERAFEPCERAFEHERERYGKDETLTAIGGLIPFDDPKLPILHHVAKHAPQYMEDFACRYRSATYFRDCEGRTLHQTTLASGHKTFNNNAMFFLQMSDEQVREIDPGSDLYPFMVAASGQTCDLSAVYALLRRNPSLAHRNKKPKRRRKRKRK